MEKQKEHIEWIDSVKGIGIIGVVIGHIFMPDTFIHKAIYLFHMPLFFFISGCLYRAAIPNKEYISKKFKSLIIPYLAIFVLLYPILALFYFPYGLSSQHMISDIAQIHDSYRT